MGSANLKANEPSMEDILASIRRIIADDQEVVRSLEAEDPPSPLKNVLDLTELHLSPVPPPPEPQAQDNGDGTDVIALQDNNAFQEDDAISHIVSRYERGPDPPQPTMVRPVSRGAPAQAPETTWEGPLLSNETKACISDSFDRLGSVLMPKEPRTLEDLMREMLRPMLKAWLDDNLPSIVERLVQAEIERVVRGRR
jgi:cell pole-organizing protein PopZ